MQVEEARSVTSTEDHAAAANGNAEKGKSIQALQNEVYTQRSHIQKLVAHNNKLRREALKSSHALATKENVEKIQLLQEDVQRLEKEIHERDMAQRQEKRVHQFQLKKLTYKMKQMEAAAKG